MQDYIVNEFISLKLEGSMTEIYINDKPFQHCKYLLISIPSEEREDFDGYDTMDEIIEAAGKEADGMATELTIEEEFWGHCSNIQTWVENHYDYRILDTKLSIPIILKIMKSLTKKGGKEKFRNFFMEVVNSLDDYIINSLQNEALYDKFTFLKGMVCRTTKRYFSDAEISGSILLTQVYNRFLEDYLIEREKRREYNRKKGQFNRWEAKLWGTGKVNLKRRKFLRLVRSDDYSVRSQLVVSHETDYLPYLYAKGQFIKAGNISLCYLNDDTLIIRDEEGNYWKDTTVHDRSKDYGYSNW